MAELPESVERAVRRFMAEEARFAQLTTVDAEGFPVTRTVGATLNDDWTVHLIQRRHHRRLAQLRANPRLELAWVGSPAPGATNEEPAVYDFGWLPPRVVFVRGTVEFQTAEWTLAHYRRESARLLSQGHTKAPDRDDDDVRRNLAGLVVRPAVVRVEGFGCNAQSFTWRRESET